MEAIGSAFGIALLSWVALWTLEQFLPGLYSSVARLVLDDIKVVGTIVVVFLTPFLIGCGSRFLNVTEPEYAAAGGILGAFIRIYPGLLACARRRCEKPFGAAVVLLLFVGAYGLLPYLGYSYSQALRVATDSGLTALGKTLVFVGSRLSSFIGGAVITAIVNKYGARIGRINSPFEGGTKPQDDGPKGQPS